MKKILHTFIFGEIFIFLSIAGAQLSFYSQHGYWSAYGNKFFLLMLLPVFICYGMYFGYKMRDNEKAPVANRSNDVKNKNRHA